MKRLVIAFCLSVSSIQAFGQGAGAPPPVPAEAPKQPTSFMSDGSSAVEIAEAGFKIIPPAGWEVIPGGSGARLLFQAPKPADVPGVFTLRPSMRVMMFDEAVPMDDATKDLYYKKIIEGNSNASAAISNYMIRSAEPIKLANGMTAFLYYAEYTHNTVPTMQMHVLVSNAHKHFIMTYTDLASVFESQGAGLTTAYTSMQGVTLDSAPPERFTTMIYIGAGIVIVLLLLIVMRVVRGYRMKKLGERIESEDGGDATTDDDNDYSRSGVSAISEVADTHDHDDDYEMPETREAPARRAEAPAAPTPKKAPPAAPAPKAPAPAPKPAPVVAKQKPVAPKPEPVKAAMPVAQPAPTPAAFEARTRKKTVSSEAAPPPHVSAVSESDAPSSSSWNLSESDAHDDDNDFESSDVSELKSKPAIAPATKSKHQKAAPPARKEEEMDDDVSQVARLSEILPNTGDSKKKKKGFFGWGKKKDEDDDQVDSPMNDSSDLDGDDDWDNGSKKKAKDKGYKEDKASSPKAKTVAQAKSVSAVAAQPVSQVSEIADGWNLSEGRGKHDSDDDED